MSDAVFSVPEFSEELGVGTSFTIKYILNRVYNQDKNFMASVLAQTGGGKSTTALAFMEILNPDKSPEELIKNVCFTPREFLERATDENNEKGTVIIADEAGVSQNSKQWQSVYNRVANFVLQTFRYRNLVVFFCLPNFTFLDSDTRKLLHAVFEIKKIDKSNNTTIVKPLFIQTSNHTGKVYQKYLRVKNNGVIVPVKTIRIKKPSEELINLYLEKKKAFAQGLYQDIIDKVEQVEAKDKKKPVQVGEGTLTSPLEPFTESQRKAINALFKFDDGKDAAIYCDMAPSSFFSTLARVYRKTSTKSLKELKELVKKCKENGIFEI